MPGEIYDFHVYAVCGILSDLKFCVMLDQGSHSLLFYDVARRLFLYTKVSLKSRSDESNVSIRRQNFKNNKTRQFLRLWETFRVPTKFLTKISRDISSSILFFCIRLFYI